MAGLAIFDLDNTLVKGQSQLFLLKYAKKKRLVGHFFYFKIISWFILYKLNLVENPREMMEYAAKLFKGMEIEDVNKLINDFFETSLKKKIFQEGTDLIKKHRRAGREIVIISNSVNLIPAALANFLNIKYFFGTKLEVENGKFTGKIKGDIIYGKNKVSILNNFLQETGFSLKGSYGYGDHESDIFILSLMANPFAVNPTEKLLKEARKRNWPVLNFKHCLK